MRPLLFASLLAATSPAFALSCGDDVLRDTVLTADLHCPDGDYALRLARHGVTLDLNGYTLSGRADIGVLADDVRGARVTGGRLAGFRVGIESNRSEALQVDGLVFNGLGDGLRLHNASGARISGNRFEGLAGHAVAALSLPWAMSEGGGHRIEDNRIIDSEYGVLLSGYHGGHSAITSNHFDRLGTFAVQMHHGSHGNVVAHNHFGETGVAAIAY